MPGGSDDNALFTIAGNQLKTAVVLTREHCTYSIRVRMTDQGSLSFDKTLTVTGVQVGPYVTFVTAAETVSEGVGTVVVEADLSEAIDEDVVVPLTVQGTAVNPADYTLPANFLVIPAGTTHGSISVTIVDNALDEGDETVTLTQGQPTNASAGRRRFIPSRSRTTTGHRGWSGPGPLKPSTRTSGRSSSLPSS